MKHSLFLSTTLLTSLLFLRPNTFAQEAKLNIIEPQVDQQISGSVKIRVVAEGNPAPARMYVGLGKANWRELDRDESSGEWIGTLDSTLIPNGTQVVNVYTDTRKVRAAQRVKVENPIKGILR